MAQVTINTPRETTHQRIADALEGIVGKITDTSKSSNIDYDNSTSKLTAVKVQDAIDELASEKVDKEQGKGLSSNDFTTAYKEKVDDTYSKSEVDNKFSTLESNIVWKEPVATYNDIATTYPNPQDGWTVNVKDTDYTYRYSGAEWVAISANAIPKATTSVDGLMTTTQVTKLDGIQSGAEVNVQSDWNETNTNLDAYIKNKPNIYNKTEVDTALSNKVDKVSGKGLSTNDYTNEDKQKVASIKDDDISSNITGTKEVTVTDSTKAPIISFKGNGYTVQDGTPTPDNPIPIQGYGDMGWFDGKLIAGHYEYGNNGFVSVGTNHYSNHNLIECKEGDILTLIYEKTVSYEMTLFFFDELKNQIAYYNFKTCSSAEATAPTNAKYFSFTIIDNSEGHNTIDTCYHITVLKNNMYCAPVKSVGKNLFGGLPFAEALNKASTTSTIDTQNKTVTFNHSQAGEAENGGAVIYNNFKPNARYTFVLNGAMLNNSEKNDSIQILYADGTMSRFYIRDSTYKNYIIVSESGKSISALTLGWNNGALAILNYEKCGIFEGVITEAEFEEYKESVSLIPTSQPFYQGDYIQLNADGSGVEHREYGVVQLEDLTWSPNGGTLFYSSRFTESKVRANGWCTTFDVVDSMPNDSIYTLLVREATYNVIYARVNNVNQLKGTLVYELETPTNTPLTKVQLQEIRKLMSFNNQTTFSTEPYNSEFEVEYYKNTKNGKVVGGVESKLNEIYQLLSKV